MDHNHVAHDSGWARPQERPFLRRLEDLAWRAQTQNSAITTDFLTMREQTLAQSVAGRFQLHLSFWGGYESAQRKRGLLAPDFWQPTVEEYQVSVLRGKLPGGKEVSHRDVMGSLLGTGVKRTKVGDIGLDKEIVYVAVDSDMASYVLLHWHAAGRVSISLEEIENVSRWPVPDYKPVEGAVSSLRLDAIIAEFCKWSRSQAQQAISQSRISLNSVSVSKPDEQLAQGDEVSVRGFGRLKLMSVEGETRRGKLRVLIGVLKS